MKFFTNSGAMTSAASTTSEVPSAERHGALRNGLDGRCFCDDFLQQRS